MRRKSDEKSEASESRYVRALANLEGALVRFRDQAVRLGAEERTRAMALLLKAADDLLRLGFTPMPGKAAIAMYLDELAEEAAGVRNDDPITS